MRYYLIGIKGSGMSALASILNDLGNEVIGYDDYKNYKFTEDGLTERNIKIYYDQSAHLDENTTVIYSGSFKKTHREIVRAEESNTIMKDYKEALKELSERFETISVSGTHGKTTVSLMLTNVLELAGGVNYFIGDGTGKGNPNNDNFILESCEFNKNFLSYSPTDVIVNNLELDHTETYPTIESIIETFEEFSNKTKRHLVLNGDNEHIRKMNTKIKPFYFGLEEENDLYANNIRTKNNMMLFDTYINNEFYETFELNFFGEYMVYNALSVIGISYLKNVDKKLIKQGLREFRGAKRRFNEYHYDDVTIVDDYAHHPTAIKVTIEAAKQKYPNKEIVSVFLPNTYSRVGEFDKEFADSLSLSNKTYVMDILSDRESQEDYEGITSDLIIDKMDNAEKIDIESVEKLNKHNDAVVLFMSCTNIYDLEDKYKENLEKKIS